jgi:hypothetical protein
VGRGRRSSCHSAAKKNGGGVVAARPPHPLLMSFAAHARKRARWVRAGGLKSAEDVSQVHPASYEPLARMNELGLVTIDSQDACTPEGRPEPTERAYVAGFMRRARAERFVEAFNTRTDKVAVLLLPAKVLLSSVGMRPIRSAIPVTVGASSGRAVTRSPLYLDAREYAFLKTRPDVGGLGASEDAVLVECIDPAWGRPANRKRGGLFREVVAVLEEAP